ncbi:MAG: hypothetical protein R6X35_08630, partial [Candidatus Krumholzibacteriia bacterium]
GLALALGLLPDRDQATLRARRRFVAAVGSALARATATDPARGLRLPAQEWLRQPQARLADLGVTVGIDGGYIATLNHEAAALTTAAGSPRHAAAALAQVENSVRYEGYIRKHGKLLQNQEHLGNLDLPSDLDYCGVTALSFEAREKLARVRPATLGQASRIDGVRAGDLAVLAVVVRRLRGAAAAAAAAAEADGAPADEAAGEAGDG